jgi:hypothetical protein
VDSHPGGSEISLLGEISGNSFDKSLDNSLDFGNFLKLGFYCGHTEGPVGTVGVGTSELPINFDELDGHFNGQLPDDIEMGWAKEDIVTGMKFLKSELEQIEEQYPTPVPKMPIWYSEVLETENLLPREHCKINDWDYFRERDNRREEIRQEKESTDTAASVSVEYLQATESVEVVEESPHNRVVAIQISMPPYIKEIRRTTMTELARVDAARVDAKVKKKKGREKEAEADHLQLEIDKELETCPHIAEYGYCAEMHHNPYGLCSKWGFGDYRRILNLRLRQRQLLEMNFDKFDKFCRDQAKEKLLAARKREGLTPFMAVYSEDPFSKRLV